MDPKKQQSLTPELKQIYERVMNTQVSPNTPPAAPVQTATPTPSPVTPPVSAPVTPSQPMPSQPVPEIPTAPPVTQPIANNPAPNSTPAQNLGGIAQKPLSANPQPFTFSNKAPSPTQAANPNQPFSATTKPKKKMSGMIIGALVVVLVAVWTLFWIKFFNLI